MRELDPREQRIVLALAEVVVPRGERLPAAGLRSLTALDDVLLTLGPGVCEAYPYLLRALDRVARLRTGHGLDELEAVARAELLSGLSGVSGLWLALNAVLAPLRMARARELEQLDGRAAAAHLPMFVEPARWGARSLDASRFEGDQELEADAVVIGTGAGGAGVAKALAARGHAVLLLEEGALHTRADFQGDVLARQRRLYRPMTVALGNTCVLLPTGTGVGGTTTINSGTCFRPPADTLRRWRFEHGLGDFDLDALGPYLERVEAMLEVAPVPDHLMSASERVIARGAALLGYPHAPLLRNAPGCDGQSECCFGCPTDAKRSTNVSYVPAALKAGATLIYRARAERILVEAGRAVGVSARATRADGISVALSIRAHAVVLACGALETPVLLLRNRLCQGSGQLGRNLTLHPASHAWARFDHALEGAPFVPQGHCVELPGVDGVRLEGGLPPRQLAACTFTQWGPELTAMLEGFERLAFGGFMIRDDHSRGRVRLDANGRPSVRYWLDAADLQKLVRGQLALAQLFLAAGARTVFPGIYPQDLARIESDADVRRLAEAAPRLRARDFALSAFHPLGTCRMGADSARYVVGPSHETHEIESLFVCDGSAVPGPLGVNPQVTIMALAERASEFVERRIETLRAREIARFDRSQRDAARASLGGSRRTDALAAAACAGPSLAFAETMSGRCQPPGGAREGAEVVMRVRAHGALVGLLNSRGAELALAGAISVAGLAAHSACDGRLLLRPTQPGRAIVYELSFVSDAGEPWTLYGEKQIAGARIVRGMTRLRIELARADGRGPSWPGVLMFDLKRAWPWLRSLRLYA
jgi:choline dehydrogenase-like flavoprotein